jgi:hypothetical protein
MEHFVPSWLQAGRWETKCAGAQVAGLAATVLSPGMLQGLMELVRGALGTAGAGEWVLEYQCLVTLEKLMGSSPQALWTDARGRVPGELLQLLVHEHAWVRLQADVCLLVLLRRGVELQPGHHFELLKALVDQVDADALHAELAGKAADLIELAVRLAVDRPGLFLEGAEDAQGPLYWLAKRLARAYRRAETDAALKATRRGVALGSFRALVQLASPAVLPLTQIVGALQDDEEAAEVLDLCKSKVGAEAFVKALGEVREWADTLRVQRKHERDVEAVMDPAAAQLKKQMKRDREKRSFNRRRAAGDKSVYKKKSKRAGGAGASGGADRKKQRVKY